MKRARTFAAAAVLVLLGPILLVGTAAAQDAIKVKMGRIAFPTYVTVMVDLVKETGLDRKNGIDLNIVPFGAIPAYYGAVATAEVSTLGLGSHGRRQVR